VIALWLLLAGCGGSGPAPVDASPEAIGDADCAVCDMTVADQPAPHGQVVFRDGSHHFLCSLGDLRAYVQAPNPLGAPVAVYVQVLPPDFDPSTRMKGPLPWKPAGEAWYVPVPGRKLVMGIPLASFAAKADAEAFAGARHEPVFGWKALVATPFSKLPSDDGAPGHP